MSVALSREWGIHNRRELSMIDLNRHFGCKIGKLGWLPRGSSTCYQTCKKKCHMCFFMQNTSVM